MAATGGTAAAVDEERWVGEAAGGKSSAFAALYERYEQRAFNLAFRISGSEDDAADAVQAAFLKAARMMPSLADHPDGFRPFVLGATRASAHELMQRRHHRPPREVSEDGPAPDDVPAASMRLPDRQREALALAEPGDLDYQEIGSIVELSGDSVAQLLARARINLRDELGGSVLASAAAPIECERALPLIAARQDGQLDRASEDALWLEGHLGECERCRLAVRTMEEAADSYRGWAPLAAPSWLFAETLERAAGGGAGLGGETGEGGAPRAGERPANGKAFAGPPVPGEKRPRRRLAATAGLGALLLLAGGAVAVLAHSGRETGHPAATTTPAKHRRPSGTATSADRARRVKRARARRHHTGRRAGDAAHAATSASALPASAVAPVEGSSYVPAAAHPTGGHGGIAVKPTRQPTGPKATATPAKTPASSPPPQPVVAPAPAATTTSETTVAEQTTKHEPHGKAVGRPPKE